MRDRLFDIRRQKFLNFYFQKKRLPTYSEMMKTFGFRSKNAVSRLVKKFIQSRLVAKDENGRLVPKKIAQPLKVLGYIEAGFPSPAEEELIDTLSLDEYLIRNKEASFLIRVSGSSMTEAGIHPDDLVIVERGREPKNGDIIIAEIDGSWTIKYFFKKSGEITLVPANKNFKTISPKEELKIAGVVISVIRKYY